MLFESFLVALSTYSAIPVPQFEWNERNMKYALCFFPAVGVFCALGWALWYLLCRALGAPVLLFGGGAACLPLLITGGIHMDGYMDTIDALASHQTRERKLEILKDSTCGAFAVIYCGIYLILHVSVLCALYETEYFLTLLPVFVLSRTLSGLCAVNLPNARKAGMLCAYTKDMERTRANGALVVLLVLTGALTVWLRPGTGACILLSAGLWLFFYRKIAMHRFGGVTGDTSGFFLQICELCCLFGAWMGGAVL